MDVPDTWKSMEAKYTGKCFKCQKAINPGNRIFFNTQTRHVHCLNCGSNSNTKPFGNEEILSTAEALAFIREAEKRKSLELQHKSAYKKYGRATYSRVQKIREH